MADRSWHLSQNPTRKFISAGLEKYVPKWSESFVRPLAKVLSLTTETLSHGVLFLFLSARSVCDSVVQKGNNDHARLLMQEVY